MQSERKMLKSILISLLLISMSFSIRTQGYQPNLSMEEAVEIALNNPEVMKAFENYEIKETWPEIYETYIWRVYIIGINGSNQFHISVNIDDRTQEIISIRYIPNGLNENTYVDLYADSEEYYDQQPIAADYPRDEYSLAASRYGINAIGLKGEKNASTIEIMIGYNTTVTGDPQFHLTRTISNHDYFSTPFNYSEAQNMIISHPTVSDFLNDFPNNQDDIYKVHYYDSPFNGDLQGDYYEVNFINESYINAQYNGFDFDFYDDDPATEYPEYTNNPLYNIIESHIEIRNTDFIEIILDADSGDIIHLEDSYSRALETTELVNMIFDDNEVKAWVDQQVRFRGWFGYSGNRTYQMSLHSIPYGNSTYIQINDTTGEITDKSFFNIPGPALSNAELNNIIVKNPDFIAWETKVEKFVTNTEFDNLGILDNLGNWVISFYDPTIDENEGYLIVNDSSGLIIESSFSLLEIQPTMSTEQVIELIKPNTDLYDFYLGYPDAVILMYYHNNKYWSVYAYSLNYAGKYIRLLIDDKLKEIVTVSGDTTSSYSSYNSTQITDFVHSTQQYIDLIEPNNEIEEFVYYFDGYWHHKAQFIEKSLVVHNLELSITEIPLQVDYFNYYEILSNDQIDVDFKAFKNSLITDYFPRGDFFDLWKFESTELYNIFGEIETYSILHDIDSKQGIGIQEIGVVAIVGIMVIIFIIYRGKYFR